MFLKKIFNTEKDKYLTNKQENIDIPHINSSNHNHATNFQEECEEIERYWLKRPYVLICIKKKKDTHKLEYDVIEPILNEEEQFLFYEIKTNIPDIISLKDMVNIDEMDDLDKTEYIKHKILDLFKNQFTINGVSLNKILYYIKRDWIDFGILSPLMYDSYIEDIWCNEAGSPLYIYHSLYGSLSTNINFRNNDDIDIFIMRVAHQSAKHISKSSPILDTIMKDGSRINITYGKDVSPKGSSFSIRKQKKIPLTPIDLIKSNTFSSQMMAYFWLCMENGKNILFCGGTASGKTSSLNAICLFIPLNTRIVTLEDTREINLPHKNWVPTVTRDAISTSQAGSIDLEDLLRSSLRQRPEYLLVGEVRGRESQILFQAMNAGHATCSTFHAGKPQEVINRFTNPPINVPNAMFSALNIISMQKSVIINGTKARRASYISEIMDVKTTVDFQNVFEWNNISDSFIFKNSKIFEEIKMKRGYDEKQMFKDINMRKHYLEMLIQKNITEYQKIVDYIDKYNKNNYNAITELELIV